jgi:carboxypeptidase family protein/TonB-dependent receptor-like protein
MTLESRLAIAFLIVALLLGVSLCYAQAGKAEIFGLVLDAGGLPVPQATVELEDQATLVKQTSATSERGEYHFFGLGPGIYRVSVVKQGFREYRQEGLQLRVADRIPLDIRLEVGDVVQTLEVTAAAPLLQATTGTVSLVVEQKKVVTLPLDGRNFIPLLALSPGVALPPGTFFPRVNGSRPRTSEYIYDGIGVLQPEPGQVAFYPIIDAIEEFRVNTNSYSAEYGRSNGGVILVNQKSGTNDYHGSLFEFFRNEKLNARNLFATTGPKPLFRRNQYGFVFGGPIRKQKTFFFADYQGSKQLVGVVRTSTVPTSAQRRGVFSTPIFDPGSTQQTGGVYRRDQFANNTIPQNRFDSAALKALDRFPVPNVFAANGAEATANNYRRTDTERQYQDQFDGRIDHQLTPTQRVFGRYSYLRDDSRPVAPLPDGSGTITTGVIGNTLTRADGVVAEHSWTISPGSLNQLRFGYTRRGFNRDALRLGVPASQASGVPNIPASSFSDALPIYQITGFQQIGPSSNTNSEFTTSVTQLIDTFSTKKARHSLKFGMDLRWEHLNVLQPPNPTGLFQFVHQSTGGLTSTGAAVANTGNPLASFLLGQVNNFSIDLQDQTLRPRAGISEFFVQDDWKVNSRLSLNLGLRYTLNWPSTEANNRAAVFNLTTQRLDFLGKDSNPRNARDLEKHNFGPRIGLAYRITDSFVIRSGYSMTWIEQAGITTPFTTPLFPFIQTAGQRSLDNINPAFVLSAGPTVQVTQPNPDSGLGQGVFGTDRPNGSGYAQQWNLSLQKTLFSDLSIEVGYLGSKITRLGVPDVNLNQLTAEQLAQGSTLTQSVPNPYFGQIPISSSIGGPTVTRQQLLRPYPRFTAVTLYRNNIGNSVYHSFQSRVEKRFSKGLTFTTAYTYSKLIDDASSVFDAAILTGPVANFPVADSFNRKLERDLSNGDTPHIFSSGFVYELPFGKGRRFQMGGWKNALLGDWQLAGIVRLQSGIPIAITQSTNFNSFAGFGTQRPNRPSNPELPADQRTTTRFFDTAAFETAPQFTIGNSSRNPVRGPGYRAGDIMLGKTFAMTERFRMEVRAEAFNLTNTPPLGPPNGSFGTTAFGTITTALDPRVFEFVLKLHF